MKLKRIITGSLLALTMAFGVGVGISANKKAEVKPAEAGANDIKFYINTSSWGDDATGVKFYAWAWATNQEGGWYDFTKETDHIYYTEVDPSITNFIFLRAASTMPHGWTEGTNYWNKTDNCEDSTGNHNYFVFGGYSYGDFSFYKDSYIYYVSDSSASTENKIYSWRSNDHYGSYGGWSGAYIADLGDATMVLGTENQTLYFNGVNRRIYRIPYVSCDKYLLINWNGSSQSSNKTFANGYGYTWEDDGTGNGMDPQAAGAAIEFLIKAEDKRNAASYQGKEWSVCGISKSDAASLISDYNSLSTKAKSYVNASSTYTWVSASSSVQQQVSYSEIINRLSIIAGVSASSAIITGLNSKTTTNSIIVVVVVSITAIAAAGFFFFYRKKNQ